MPSAQVLEQKKQQVADIKSKLDSSVAGVLVSFAGTSVSDDTSLRADLRKSGVYYSVVKNTILRRAFEGTDLAPLSDTLEGTTAIAISESDYVAAAKILSKFAESHEKFALKGGFLDGEVISLEKIEELSKLPSKEELLATVAAVFQAPMAAFARAAKAVLDKKEEGGDASDAAAPAEETAAPAQE